MTFDVSAPGSAMRESRGAVRINTDTRTCSQCSAHFEAGLAGCARDTDTVQGYMRSYTGNPCLLGIHALATIAVPMLVSGRVSAQTGVRTPQRTCTKPPAK